MISLGLLDSRRVLPGTLSDMHIVLWKFVIIDFVKVDTEGAKFEVDKVWRAAVSRMKDRVDANRERLRLKVRSAIRRGRAPPPLESDNAAMFPIGMYRYHQDFTLHTEYSGHYLDLLDSLKLADPQ